MEMGRNMIEHELTQGHKLAKQLQAQLNSASLELCKSMVEDLLVALEKSISMAKSACAPNLCNESMESPTSFLASPHSENSELPFKAEPKENVSKKRKTQHKGTSLKLGVGPEAEGPLEDGYSWRKYGQKEILGAKHPRGYFRCTHRKSQNCLAMKQVQRSDENPNIFEVTYRGTHSCNRKSTSPITPTPSFPTLGYNANNELLINFKANLKVKTENLESKFQVPVSSLFAFPSTPNENFQFFSPSTSESNYFSASPFSCDYIELLSAVTSTTNSPSPMLDMDMDFFLDNVEFDTELPFDCSSFFQ